MHPSSKPVANTSSNPDWDEVIDEVRVRLTWEQVLRDLVHVAELLHGTILFIVTTDGTNATRFSAELNQKLEEMPEGWRVAECLRDIDQRWGHALEGYGLSLERIAARRKAAGKEQ